MNDKYSSGSSHFSKSILYLFTILNLIQLNEVVWLPHLVKNLCNIYISITEHDYFQLTWHTSFAMVQ